MSLLTGRSIGCTGAVIVVCSLRLCCPVLYYHLVYYHLGWDAAV
jgi:hypothetical protein